MSRHPRPSRRPRPSDRRASSALTGTLFPGQTVVRMSGPGQALEAIPHLFGFAPTESLVLLGLCGPSNRIGPAMRMDLVGPEGSVDEVLAAEAMSALTQQVELRATRGREAEVGPMHAVLVVVYTDEGDPDPLAPLPRLELLDEIRRRCDDLGIGIRDALVVRNGRWWSAECDSPSCCPPEGTAVTPDIPSAAGLTLSCELGAPLANRAELARSVAPDVAPGTAETVAALLEELAGTERFGRLAQATRVLDDALARCTAGFLPDLATITLLIALAQDTGVRDLCTMVIEPHERPVAVRLWQAILVGCPPPYDAQVGALFAQIAWDAGQGALASCGCERALATDPEHVLAGLIYTGLRYGLPSPVHLRLEEDGEDWMDEYDDPDGDYLGDLREEAQAWSWGEPLPPGNRTTSATLGNRAARRAAARRRSRR